MTNNQEISDEEIMQLIIDTFDETRGERDEVYEELRGESERASVLIGAAWLEESLSDLIRLVLPDDKKVADYFLKRTRPFGGRITAAKKLGLISKVEKKRLDVINEIRIKFAHRVVMTFDDSEIARLIAKLKPISVPGFKPFPELGPPQEIYAHQVSLLYFLIYGRIIAAQKFSDVTSRLDMLRGEGWRILRLSLDE